MLIIKWILVGTFLAVTNPNSKPGESVTFEINGDIFNSQADCDKALKQETMPYLDEAVKEGRLGGYVLSCKSIEMETPKAVAPTPKVKK